MRLAVTILTATVLLSLFFSCREKNKYGKIADTPTTGSITIVADESLQPIVEAEIETFNALHTKARVSAIYLPEAEAINAMLKEDSLRIAIVTRKLTKEERQYLMDAVKVRAREEELATSGISLIVNNARRDTLISIAQIKDMLTGKIKTWKQLGGTSNDGIEIVFDNPNSGVIRHLRDSIAQVDTLPANCFAVQNNKSVVEYVSKNKNALGLIGLEWISDKDDTTSNNFLNRIKVVAVAGDSAHFQPYQAYLALKYYPLLRTITSVNREGRTGLGTGFVAFFGSERGQRIVLKAGLVPKTMPLRIIQVNPKPFAIEK
jgi:phosphate transport system substrate-binding protein